MASSVAIGVPTEVLVAPGEFEAAFTADQVAEALVRGLVSSGQAAVAFTAPDSAENLGPSVAEIRAARAVIVGTGSLDRESLVGSLLSELATSARQSGVPCHAVVGSNQLDPFDTRILDLQFVIEATTLAQIEAAGAQIGAAMQSDLALGA